MILTLFLTWTVVAALLIVAWPRVGVDWRWGLGALIGSLGLCLVHQLTLETLAEDAFISFRYATNLADGNGLVFNAGERVEGYSNFLWVLLIALPRSMYGADIVVVARVLGVVCTLGCVVLAYLLGKRITNTEAAGVLAATITAASFSLAAYGPSGLETPLFALLVLATVLAVHEKRMFLAGLLVALATMTRPDGVVIAVVIGLWLIGATLLRRQRWHAVPLYVAGALVLAAPWTLWRLAYYGHLVPNALAAKSGMTLDEQLEQGWRYLGGFAVAAQALLLLVPFAWLGLILRWRLVPRGAGSTVWLLFVLVPPYAAVFTITGGDWMPAWRFFAPVMPLLAVGLAATWVLTRPREREDEPESAPPGSRLGPTLAAAVSVLLLVVSVNNGNMKHRLDQWRAELYQMASLGAWMNRTLPAGTVIATYANGALSYEAGPEVTVVDVLGLTDEHIARRGKRLRGAVVGHAAYDYDYVVNVRKPDVVFMRGNGLSPRPFCDFMIELREHYRGVVFRVAGTALWAPVFVRTERADALIARLDADPGFDRAPCPP